MRRYLISQPRQGLFLHMRLSRATSAARGLLHFIRKYPAGSLRLSAFGRARRGEDCLPAAAPDPIFWDWRGRQPLSPYRCRRRKSPRSGKRRVGEELVRTCRFWWSPYHEKKNNKNKNI